jgi:hypothetical protein
MCLAWLGLPVPGARGSASVLDKVAMRKGSHDALYGELMEYYADTNRPDGSLGSGEAGTPRLRRGRGAGIVQPVAAMKRAAVFDKAPAQQGKAQQAVVGQKQHLASDEAFTKVEMKSAVAIGVVCVGAFLVWRLRDGDSLAKEAWGGIDKSFIPIREADTGETEEQKEFARMEAARAIERAKKKEEEYARQRQAGMVPEVDVQQEGMVPGVMSAATGVTGMAYQTDGGTGETDEVGSPDATKETGETEETGETGETGSTKLGSPGLLAMALLSVMADDIRKELNNMPKHVLPESRAMVCGRVNGAGTSMAVWTPRIKMPSGSTDSSTALKGKDLLLGPIATALKEISGKNVAPFFSDKYDPMHDLHKYVNRPESDDPRHPRPDRDPFSALMSALQSFDGPVASERLAKYDPLSDLANIPVAEGEGGDEYSLVHALLRATPEKGDIDVEKLFPILGDMMAKIREMSRAQSASSAGSNDWPSTSEDDVAQAERRADEAERKAMALLERIEKKEDELLSKVQQLQTRLTDAE